MRRTTTKATLTLCTGLALSTTPVEALVTHHAGAICEVREFDPTDPTPDTIGFIMGSAANNGGGYAWVHCPITKNQALGGLASIKVLYEDLNLINDVECTAYSEISSSAYTNYDIGADGAGVLDLGSLPEGERYFLICFIPASADGTYSRLVGISIEEEDP